MESGAKNSLFLSAINGSNGRYLKQVTIKEINEIIDTITGDVLLSGVKPEAEHLHGGLMQVLEFFSATELQYMSWQNTQASKMIHKVFNQTSQ